MPPVKKSRRKLPAHSTRVREAKIVATQAIGRAAAVAADSRRNRSSRTRESYKIKALALDRVALILAGKEAA